MNVLEIWAPRWKDRTVLLAEWKLGVSNKIIFKTPSLPYPLYISGAEAMKFPLERKATKSGGLANYRAIPLTALHNEEEY